MDMLVAQRTRLVLAVKLADVFEPKEFRKKACSVDIFRLRFETSENGTCAVIGNYESARVSAFAR
jgi:hypothetical protein